MTKHAGHTDVVMDNEGMLFTSADLPQAIVVPRDGSARFAAETRQWANARWSACLAKRASNSPSVATTASGSSLRGACVAISWGLIKCTLVAFVRNITWRTSVCRGQIEPR